MNGISPLIYDDLIDDHMILNVPIPVSSSKISEAHIDAKLRAEP